MKKSYVFVGASFRGFNMFIRPMKERYSEYCDLKGVYDINPGRAALANKEAGVPVYDDFGKMLAETKPDYVIVTTVDVFHSDYVIRALEAGCDVISEKPLTIDAGRARDILEAEKRTGRRVIVSFNYRHTPLSTAMKKLLQSGAIGDVFSIHFEWLLDRNMAVSAHGTSYFRRWNSRMEKSGGLLVHKSTHHFDLVNWITGQNPAEVSAFGGLNLYGTPGSEKYAGGIRGENCRMCIYTKECPFYYEMTAEEKALYAQNEQYDGYYKDGCVFAPDINIYDTMSVNVRYDGGVLLNYSLNATCAYEGWRMSINGSRGRIEVASFETGPDSGTNYNTILVYDLKDNVTEHRIRKAAGGHGGGDERLRDMLFVDRGNDELGYMAGSLDGVKSLIIGAAANISIKEKRVVCIEKLMKNN